MSHFTYQLHFELAFNVKFNHFHTLYIYYLRGFLPACSFVFSGNVCFLLGQIHSSQVQQLNSISMVGLRSRVVVHPLFDTLSSIIHDL